MRLFDVLLNKDSSPCPAGCRAVVGF